MSDAGEIAILRVELVDIEPLIWRRVAVRTTTNLQTLHRVIQAAMGWLDYHLWEFEADETCATAFPTLRTPHVAYNMRRAVWLTAQHQARA